MPTYDVIYVKTGLTLAGTWTRRADGQTAAAAVAESPAGSGRYTVGAKDAQGAVLSLGAGQWDYALTGWPTATISNAAVIEVDAGGNPVTLASRSTYAGTDTPGTTSLLASVTANPMPTYAQVAAVKAVVDGHTSTLASIVSAVAGVPAAVWGWTVRLLTGKVPATLAASDVNGKLPVTLDPADVSGPLRATVVGMADDVEATPQSAKAWFDTRDNALSADLAGTVQGLGDAITEAIGTVPQPGPGRGFPAVDGDGKVTPTATAGGGSRSVEIINKSIS